MGKIYRVNIHIRAFSLLFAIISSGMIVLIIVGATSTLFEPFCTYNSKSFQSCLTTIAPTVVILVLHILWVIVLLTVFPSITVGTQGFKVHSVFIFKDTPWLDWQSIKKARKNPFRYPEIWHIGVEGLGASYKVNGWLFWMGISCFQIGPGTIENYNELIGTLRQERPDIFNK